MREKHVILIPIDSDCGGKVLSWSDALKWADVDSEGLKKIISDGTEVKGYYVDEALIYD
jgi:hypothetical protein